MMDPKSCSRLHSSLSSMDVSSVFGYSITHAVYLMGWLPCGVPTIKLFDNGWPPFDS